jgi:DNA polymerase-3 subunit gamma/tau
VSLALYRKYRPGSFAEVMGQDHVTVPLRQALRNGKVSHAYLFSGPRGCGKTSSARILARSLNCAQGPTPDPCGVCESCVALAPNGPGSLDVVEIDAASHGGVDDARDLRERAFYAPVSSRYKVYIIDEAHMVSREGFNALLKLVEEPPEFLRFVFATTEPEKVLQTIRSRTHHYPFRLMPRKELTELLATVVDKEGVPVDRTVLPLVVRAAAGSARDGLSILDQVLASAGPDGVTRDMAADLLGVTPETLLDDVIDAFAARDAATVFATVDRVMEGGHDPRRFAQDVLEHLRDLVIYDAVPDAAEKGVLDCPPDKLERMARQAQQMGTAGLSRAADLLHEGLTEMRGTTAPRLLLELVCARVLLPTASSDDGAVLARLERLERRLDIAGTASGSAPPVVPPSVPGPAHREHPPAPAVPDRPAVASPPPAPAERAAAAWPTIAAPGGGPAAQAPAPEPPPVAPSPDPADSSPAGAPAPGGMDAAALRRDWDHVLETVRDVKRVAWTQLVDTQVVSLEGGVLTLSFAHAGTMRAFQKGSSTDYLRDALRQSLGLDVDIACVLGGGGHEPVAARSAPGRAEAPEPPPSPYDGFAPGDEAVPDDPDAPPPPPPQVRGEDAALDLVRSQLGGKVLDTREG